VNWAELGRRYRRKRHKSHEKKTALICRGSEEEPSVWPLPAKKKLEVVVVCTLECLLSLGVEGYVERVGSADVEDALDCSCSSDPG